MKLLKKFLIFTLVIIINLMSGKDVYADKVIKSENMYWIIYTSENCIEEYDPNMVGKWMYFFENKDFVDKICLEAVERGIVASAKFSNKPTGVACFYIRNDLAAHKRVLSYFFEKHLIPKTKNGKFYNISFKFDSQTFAGEYGGKFCSAIRLSNFVDLETGEWLV